MKKIILGLILISGFVACADESDEIKPRTTDIEETMFAADGDVPPSQTREVDLLLGQTGP